MFQLAYTKAIDCVNRLLFGPILYFIFGHMICFWLVTKRVLVGKRMLQKKTSSAIKK